MGRMIERIATQRGHTIVQKIDVDTHEINYSTMDVAIDFSMPNAAFENISGCLKNQVPVISGTTGWLDSFEKAVEICQEQQGAFIYASNFSLGVNVFFELNRFLAEMMKNLSDYHVSLEEIHHTKKLDAPSGTAISLAEDILKKTDYKGWKLNEGAENEITITSKRLAEVPGTHTVDYASTIDSIQLKHTAHNREGFALGAVVAAEWILGKTGVFTMKDVLGL